MVKIEATVRPYVLDKVRDALVAAGAKAITITEAKGFAGTHGEHQVYRGAEFDLPFHATVRVETVVPDGIAATVVKTLAAAARTGKADDGTICTQTVHNAIRIDTGATGERAL